MSTTEARRRGRSSRRRARTELVADCESGADIYGQRWTCAGGPGEYCKGTLPKASRQDGASNLCGLDCIMNVIYLLFHVLYSIEDHRCWLAGCLLLIFLWFSLYNCNFFCFFLVCGFVICSSPLVTPHAPVLCKMSNIFVYVVIKNLCYSKAGALNTYSLYFQFSSTVDPP